MKFRLGYATDAKHLGNRFRDTLQIPIDDNYKSQVTFRLPTSNEIERRPKLTNQVFIVAEGEYPVAQDILEILSCLESRRLPPGAITLPETAGFLGSDGKIKERHGVPLKAMPEQYRRFQSDVYYNLYQNLQRAFRLLRWRYNLAGPHNPLHLALDIQYSRDGETWAGAPRTLSGSFSLGPFSWPIEPQFLVANEIGDLLTKGADEPICHALLREAWDQRSQNPRSALVIGIAAAEVGLKECITHLSPETRWLVENIQTPPLDKLLVRYWEELPKMPLANKKRLKIPKKLIKDLKRAIEERNKIVHLGAQKIKPAEVEELLESIRDLLLIFDCAQGYFWAFEYVQAETRQSMAAPPD